jgi:hypothetical protein
MPLLLLLAMLLPANTPAVARGGVIEATIRGTEQPLEVELLRRDANEQWNEVARQRLPVAVRRVHFDGLDAGVYQLRVGGRVSTERMAAKLVLGSADTRRVAIDIEPFVIKGTVTLGGTSFGRGTVVLRHREFLWRGAVALDADGAFTATLWQRGTFAYNVTGPALPTEYSDWTTLDGSSRLAIAIPDGRVTGVVRDRAGAPLAGVTVLLQTATAQREDNVRLTTGPDGRFDFTGVKYGRNTVRLLSPGHLEPDPVVFDLGGQVRQRELDIRLESGRDVAIVVIDRNNDPVAKANIFTVAEGKVRARTVTDEDGRAGAAVPAGQDATLFVVPEEGPFAMLHVGREETAGRLRIHLPATSSSLLIRALTTDGQTMPPFSLLMRFNGELMPVEVTEELTAVQGLRFTTGRNGEALLTNIPSGSYEFWPYRSGSEADAIVASGSALLAPIQVDVRTGDNRIAVRFARR